MNSSVAMKKVTGQLVIYPNHKPNQTPNKAAPTETANIAGTLFARYFAIKAGKVTRIKTNNEPSIWAAILTLIAKRIRK